jgi:hypothetical protein
MKTSDPRRNRLRQLVEDRQLDPDERHGLLDALPWIDPRSLNYWIDRISRQSRREAEIRRWSAYGELNPQRSKSPQRRPRRRKR